MRKLLGKDCLFLAVLDLPTGHFRVCLYGSTQEVSPGCRLTEKMPIRAKISSTTLFIKELVNQPRQVGAVLPSSKKLAKAMAKWLPKDSHGLVLELGPGTGVVTDALIERGMAQERLVAIEMSAKMAEHLQKRYPKATIINGDAFKLDEILKKHTPKGSKVDVVFSSLPLLNFEPSLADDLARKIKAVLPPDGKLIQYSYNVANKQPKAAAHFHFVASDLIWLNVPPARVIVYKK